MRVYSPTQLHAVDYHTRGDGFSDIRLRKKIEQVVRTDQDGKDYAEWSADEVYIVSTMTRANVEADFANLFAAAEKSAMSEIDRIDTQEAVITDIQLAMVDIYEATLGGAK